jgi:tetratricopeptide (TPR) repeat protein
VFGNARTAGGISAITVIRPTENPVLPQGRMDPRQLLPLPPPVTWTLSAGALAAADPVYRALALLSHDLAKDLDAARVAASKGRRAESLRLYESLGRRVPGMRLLLLERASVLASFGEHKRAVELLRSNLDRYPADVELRMLAAHNAWWSEQPLLADSLLALALALDSTSADALRLRKTVRGSTSPPLRVALEWARQGGAMEQLILARAYVREQQYGASIDPYRQALASPELRSDSLMLEAASAATAADSLIALERFTDQYLATRPTDSEALLRVARAYSWRGDYANALRQYARVDQSSDSVRFEIGQVLVWAGKEREAERELKTVVDANPRHAEALKLLGDLATWHARWTDAEAYYASAQQVSPAMPGLSDAIFGMRQSRERERIQLAQSRAIPEAYDVAFDGYADNQHFRWATTRATRSFSALNSRFRATAQHNVLEGTPTGFLSRNPGISGRLEGQFDLGTRARVTFLGGAESYASIRTFPVYGAGFSVYDVLGGEFGLRFSHEPAAVLVGSLVALQAQTISDALIFTATKTHGDWALWARAEGDMLSSIAGETRRGAAAASLTRTLSSRLSASLAVSALAYDRPAPTIRGWGNLYWAPERFIEPLATVTYRAPLSPSLALTTGTSFGYGFARERNFDRRFGSGATPTGGASVDLAYTTRRWVAGAGASVNGALGTGYRSGTIRAQGAYRFGGGR